MLFMSKNQLVPTNANLARVFIWKEGFSKQIASSSA